MILSTETKADIRRLHDIWLARLAFEYRCEQTDVLAAIEPAAPAAQPIDGPAPAKHAVEEPSASEGSGGVQDRCESTPPPLTPERAPEKAADAPPAGEASPHVSPAPSQDQPPPQPVRPERSTSVPAKRPAAIVVPPAGKVTTILDRVRVVHQQHPTWTASMIAKHLGANANSVSTLLATVRRQERGEQAPPPPTSKPEFEGRAELLQHYDGVGKRLGKVR